MTPAQASSPDFARLFEALPSPHMILDRGLRFVEANDAYCRVVGRSRESMVGRYIFDLFPNPGEGGQRLLASFNRVLETGAPDSIPFIPYPIQRPESLGSGVELRYWSAVHTPLRDPAGEVAFILQNTVDVTDLQRLKDAAYGPSGSVMPGESQLLQRAREVEATNRALQDETQGLRELFMQAPGFMAVLTGYDLVYTLANHAYLNLISSRAVVGLPLAQALPEVVEQGFVDLLRRVMATKTAHIDRAASVALQRTPGAPLEERFLDFIFQPILGADGEAVGVFVEGSDVTDRVMGERQQKLLLDELNHRVKNTLATVQAIADQTLRTNANPKDFRQAFEARLMALSATHNLLTAGNWQSAALRDVAQLELRPHGPERYRLEGPDVALTSSQALALGLLFHELATNAAKHGALAHGDGKVVIGWRVEAGVLLVDWAELDGPQVTPPTRLGFGTRLIERSLQGQLRGEAALDYAPDGVRCHIRLPLVTA